MDNVIVDAAPRRLSRPVRGGSAADRVDNFRKFLSGNIDSMSNIVRR